MLLDSRICREVPNGMARERGGWTALECFIRCGTHCSQPPSLKFVFSAYHSKLLFNIIQWIRIHRTYLWAPWSKCVTAAKRRPLPKFNHRHRGSVIELPIYNVSPRITFLSNIVRTGDQRCAVVERQINAIGWREWRNCMCAAKKMKRFEMILWLEGS